MDDMFEGDEEDNYIYKLSPSPFLFYIFVTCIFASKYFFYPCLFLVSVKIIRRNDLVRELPSRSGPGTLALIAALSSLMA